MAQAEDCPREAVALQEAAGRVSAEFAYLYPPGIPLLVPGEEIPAQLPQLLAHWQKIGLSLQGLADYSGQSIQVVCD